MSTPLLVKHGILCDDAGQVHLSAKARFNYGRLKEFIARELNLKNQITYSPMISHEVLQMSGYIENFPQQLIALASDEETQLGYFRPAACLEWYQQFQNRNMTSAQQSLVEARCGRYEKSHSPWRLMNFEMIERILLADQETVLAELKKMEDLAQGIFAGLKLEIEVKPATDAFFLGQDSGSQMMQKLRRLKLEYVFNWEKQTISLASRNNHQDYFGKKFGIKYNEQMAHSACLAFGIERIMMAMVLTHGDNFDVVMKDLNL